MAGHETICFALPSDARPAPERMELMHRLWRAGQPKLSNRASLALSRLLPAMICGEESAVLVFHELKLDAEACQVLRHKLGLIEDEERTHHAMLSWLRSHLPVPVDLARTQARAKRFFERMDSRDLKTHLGRIVELDSAVCRLMHGMGQCGDVRAEPSVREVFDRIRRDESRHVALARDLRLALGWPADPDIDDRDFVASCIARLLDPLTGAFEDLGVDPDRLFRSFRAKVA